MARWWNMSLSMDILTNWLQTQVGKWTAQMGCDSPKGCTITAPRWMLWRGDSLDRTHLASMTRCGWTLMISSGRMLPKKITTPTVEEPIALLYHDDKCRFEFQCVARHQMATRKGLAYWPFKIRAVQGHTKRAISTAAALRYLQCHADLCKFWCSSGKGSGHRENHCHPWRHPWSGLSSNYTWKLEGHLGQRFHSGRWRKSIFRPSS